MAAAEWHIRPSALGLCRPDEDLSVMVAYVDTKNKMSAKEQLEADKAAKRKR